MMRLNTISPARLAALGLDPTNPTTRALLTSQDRLGGGEGCGLLDAVAGLSDDGDSRADAAAVSAVQRQSVGVVLAAGQQLVRLAANEVHTAALERAGCELELHLSEGAVSRIDGVRRGVQLVRPRIQQGVMPRSRPVVWVTSFTYVTPAVSSSKLVRQVTGGWMWGGLMRYASGALIAATGSRNNLSTHDSKRGR